MSRFFDLVSRQVREIGGYAPAPPVKPANGQRQLIRLDSNENPFGPSSKAVEAMRGALPIPKMTVRRCGKNWQSFTNCRQSRFC